MALENAILPVLSNLVGCGNVALLRYSYKTISLLTVPICFTIVSVLFIFRDLIARLYTD